MLLLSTLNINNTNKIEILKTGADRPPGSTGQQPDIRPGGTSGSVRPSHSVRSSRADRESGTQSKLFYSPPCGTGTTCCLAVDKILLKPSSGG